MAAFADSPAAGIAVTVVSIATAFASWTTLFVFAITEHMLIAAAITAVMSFPAVAAHELGHALAAMRYRQPILAFAVLPLELRFRPLRLRLAGRNAGRDLGGYVLFGDGDPSRRTVGLIAAAGPLASFALGGVAAAAGLLLMLLAPDLGGPLVASSGGAPTGLVGLPSDADIAASLAARLTHASMTKAAGLCHALAILSAGMGIVNLIPRQGSDGDVILRCLLRPWSDGARQP